MTKKKKSKYSKVLLVPFELLDKKTQKSVLTLAEFTEIYLKYLPGHSNKNPKKKK